MTTKTILIIGPTAVGKSTILDRALNDYPQLVDIITYTTRAMRQGESEGHPYHFVSREDFQKKIEQGFFVEWANVHGNLYGTPRDQIEATGKAGKAIIIDIDVQGAKVVLKEFTKVASIFLMPPSEEALRQRFIKRGVTSEADLAKRLESAKVEMAQARDFHHIVVNDNFDLAYAQVRKIIENLLENQ